MTYVFNVAFEVDRPLSQSDPDVRWISRLPGYRSLERVSGQNARYELSFEVEAGSRRDATDAAEDELVEYRNALAAYHPMILSELVTAAA